MTAPESVLAWGQGWGWKGRGAWKPKVSFGVDNWAWPNSGLNGLRRGNLARKQSLMVWVQKISWNLIELQSDRNLRGLSCPTPIYPPSIAKGGDQGPRGPICRVAEGAQVPPWGKPIDVIDLGWILDPTFQEVTGHGPPKAQHGFNGTKPSIFPHRPFLTASIPSQMITLETGKRAVTSLKARLQIVTPSINRLGTMNHHKYEDTHE